MRRSAALTPVTFSLKTTVMLVSVRTVEPAAGASERVLMQSEETVARLRSTRDITRQPAGVASTGESAAPTVTSRHVH